MHYCNESERWERKEKSSMRERVAIHHLWTLSDPIGGLHGAGDFTEYLTREFFEQFMAYERVCICARVGVCERERERERELDFYYSFLSYLLYIILHFFPYLHSTYVIINKIYSFNICLNCSILSQLFTSVPVPYIFSNLCTTFSFVHFSFV